MQIRTLNQQTFYWEAKMEAVDDVTLGKRKREETSESASEVRDNPVDELNELDDILMEKCDSELLLNSFRQDFNGCSYPMMIYVHQLSAFYQSIAQATSSSLLTCVDAASSKVVDSGELDREIAMLRRKAIVKVIVPRVGHVHDNIIVYTDDYLSHIAKYIDSSLHSKLSSFLVGNNLMSFSMKFLEDNASFNESEIDQMIAQGVLRKDNFMSLTPNVSTDDATTSCLWLSSPIIGFIRSNVDEAEKVVIRLLRKGKYKEMLEKKLEEQYKSMLGSKLGAKLLPWRYIMLELYHRGKIRTIKSPRGTVIRLTD